MAELHTLPLLLLLTFALIPAFNGAVVIYSFELGHALEKVPFDFLFLFEILLLVLHAEKLVDALLVLLVEYLDLGFAVSGIDEGVPQGIVVVCF